MDWAALDRRIGIAAPAPEVEPPTPLGGLVWRPALRNRKAIRYLTIRSFGATTRRLDIAAFKAEKQQQTIAVIDAAAAEVAQVVAALFGGFVGW